MDYLNKLALVPSFGFPASDKLLTAVGSSSLPLTPIGRLSVVYKNEISDYLEKVKEYEQMSATKSPYINDMGWRKDVVHVTGASDDITTDILLTSLNGHKKIIEDTLYGAKVSTFSKATSQSVETLKSVDLEAKMNNGLGMLTYFGHSSSTTLEFNLDDPQNYQNAGKYPVFVVMGCNAGDFFTFNGARLSVKETISERSILAKQRGSIAFLASTHLGIVHYLDIYNTNFYQALSTFAYGATLGELMDIAIQRVFAITSENDFYARFQCEEFTLHGDPAIRLYNSAKPDYAIEDPMVKVSPGFISVADNNFNVTATLKNIGRATNDSVVIEMKRVFPDLSFTIIRDTIKPLKNTDTISFTLPIGIRDVGLNKIIITIDPDNKIAEEYESNNSISKDVYIFEDEVRPVYPYDFSIVNKQGIKLVASTANAFAVQRGYLFEMDTTSLFNSPLKESKSITSTGGILEFNSALTFKDSTVYYWRVAPSSPTGATKWNESSFEFIGNGADGFAQSHLYQHFKSSYRDLILDSTKRTLAFDSTLHGFFVKSGVFPTSFSQAAGFSVSIDDKVSLASVCGVSGLVFNVIDPVTLQPWFNAVPGASQYGSDAVCASDRQYNFQFNILDINKRKKIVEFLDLIPDGYFVVVRNISGTDPASNTYAQDWKNDASSFGTGNTIYDKLYSQGFTSIDSFNRPRAFAFIYKKNNPGFPAKFNFSEGVYDAMTLSYAFNAPHPEGEIKSPVFGPAKAWKELHWRGKTIDPTFKDMVGLSVYGIDNVGQEVKLKNNLDFTSQDYDISSISATDYPYLRLGLNVVDSSYFTPYQLKYWMLTYDPVPEGAMASNLYMSVKDTVEAGEPYNFGVAFKNIGEVNFDSIKIKFSVTDRNNVEKSFYSKQKPLLVGDTIKFNMPVDTRGLSGNNMVFVNFNPDNDQPEHHLFNNYAFKPLYVKPDSLSPLLDVTFDGIHILNNDIVSSKPGIIIKLKDETKWMILNDTSLTSISVRFPDNSLHRAYFANNSDTLQFIPVGQAPSTDNTATVNYKPYFYQDGNYELIISAKDRSDNAAGKAAYRVAFQVINKPMISNMLNYPNPFTTSTAFVFTLTGSEVPQNIRIQILTITGKIVREIKKEELGPLRIGRNITEFKWDGTDQYGDKLANGIYLYRVITNLNGKSLDKYKAKDDNTDKFFNNGYGKMYLMR